MRRALTQFSPRRLARWLALICAALCCLTSLAQDTGQICVRAYVDQNEDGQRAGSEIPIVRGIAASLLDDRDLTIASQFLEDSPYAADGLLCFDQLLAGEYSVIISSSEYIATTATSAEASVRPGTAPARIDFGAKPLAVLAGPSAIADLVALDADGIQTLLLAAGAAALAIIVMSLLGCLLVALILRRRKRAKMPQPRDPAMRGLPTEPPAEDEAPPRPTKALGEGSPPLFTDEDQEW